MEILRPRAVAWLLVCPPCLKTESGSRCMATKQPAEIAKARSTSSAAERIVRRTDAPLSSMATRFCVHAARIGSSPVPMRAVTSKTVGFPALRRPSQRRPYTYPLRARVLTTIASSYGIATDIRWRSALTPFDAKKGTSNTVKQTPRAVHTCCRLSQTQSPSRCFSLDSTARAVEAVRLACPITNPP